MLISCNNCHKKFDVNSNLIPEKGRLLECSNCKNKWFFKKEIINAPIAPIAIKVSEEKEPIKVKIPEVKVSFKSNDSIETVNPAKIEILDTIQLLDNKINNDYIEKNISSISNNNLETNSIKGKKHHNLIRITIIFIISFVAMIITIDTFKDLISLYFPNIEFLLYNLYESIKDMELFLRDLA